MNEIDRAERGLLRGMAFAFPPALAVWALVAWALWEAM